jgi:hypothetical protein
MNLVQQIKMKREFMDWAAKRKLPVKKYPGYGERVWRFWANRKLVSEGKQREFKHTTKEIKYL